VLFLFPSIFLVNDFQNFTPFLVEHVLKGKIFFHKDCIPQVGSWMLSLCVTQLTITFQNLTTPFP
jgi:hypothetical protein